MISEQQEAAAAEARARARQDKKVPLLINKNDFRLLPNTPLIRKLQEYIPYEGKPTDDEPTRRRYVEGRAHDRPRVINSRAETDAIDIGVLTKDELISFALGEHGVMLDAGKDVRTLRKEFMQQLAKMDGEPPPEAMN